MDLVEFCIVARVVYWEDLGCLAFFFFFGRGVELIDTPLLLFFLELAALWIFSWGDLALGWMGWDGLGFCYFVRWMTD